MLPRALAHRHSLRIALLALVLALLAYGILHHASKRPLAPQLPQSVLRGGAVTLADLRGHPFVVAFWASWCPGCHTEATALERFATSPSGRGRLVAIDYSDPLTSHVRAFLDRYHWTFPVLDDPNGTNGDAYGVASLPATVIVNAAGRIVARRSGPQTVASLDRALSAAG